MNGMVGHQNNVENLSFSIFKYRNHTCCFVHKDLPRLIVIQFWLILYVSVNRYGLVETVSSPNHTFSWASLTKRLTSTLCTYFRL